MIIRELLSDDIYKQSERLSKLFNEFDSVDSPIISLDVLYATFSERAKNPCIRTYVAVEENLPAEPVIVGTCTLIIEPKFIHGGRSLVAHLEDVVVLSEYRGKGIGQKLVKHAVKIARKYKAYKIKLYCSDDNKKFYAKLGFKVNTIEMEKYI